MKVAVVHDWLNGMRGGENVLEAILEMYPQADLFTLISQPKNLSKTITRHRLHNSFLNAVPGIHKHYRKFLPLMPAAIEAFDLGDYELVISSSHCVAKGVKKNPGALHVAYVHSPMRYIWDRFEDYFGPGKAGFITRLGANLFRSFLQSWDRKSSMPGRIDFLFANSHFVQQRILNTWRRTSQILYPFADLERFTRLIRRPANKYLYFGALAPNKRVDLLVRAACEGGFPLQIAGEGSEMRRLVELAKGHPNVEFLGEVTRDQVNRLYSEAKAFLFSSVEDFGIVLIEALASGCPVIAFKEGGATEIINDKTGIFFENATTDSVLHAVSEFERRLENGTAPNALDCREKSMAYSKKKFQMGFAEGIETARVLHNFQMQINEKPIAT